MREKGKWLVFTAVIVSFLLATTLLATADFGADILTVANLNYQSESGSVSVEVGSTQASTTVVSLIMVLEDEQTGRIIEIDTDTKAVDSSSAQTFSANVSAPSSSQLCRYYLWENGRRIPIENNPPAETPSVGTDEITTTSVSFSWAAADDDKASVGSYNIYRLNSVENKYDYIGFSDVTSCTDTNREYGEDVSYKIETVDTEGLVSEEGTILNTKTSVPVNIVTNTAMEGTSLSPVENGIKIWKDNTRDTYAYQVAGFAGGRYCTMSTEHIRYGTTRIVGYGYYNVSDESIPERRPEDTEWTVINPVLEITYFDEGTDTVRIEYNASNGAFSKRTEFAKTDTNVWKTKLVELPNASFFEGDITGSAKNTIEGLANFRINQYTASNANRPGLAISNIAIGLRETYIPMSAYISAENGIEARFMDFDPGMEIIKLQNGEENVKDTQGFELFNTVEYVNEDDVLTEIDGIKCFKLPEYAVKMDDGGKLASKSDVTLEITYFDGGTPGASIEYCGGETAIPLTGDNKWKKKEIVLTGSSFDGSLISSNGSSADFIVKSTDGSELCISKIRAY